MQPHLHAICSLPEHLSKSTQRLSAIPPSSMKTPSYVSWTRQLAWSLFQYPCSCRPTQNRNNLDVAAQLFAYTFEHAAILAVKAYILGSFNGGITLYSHYLHSRRPCLSPRPTCKRRRPWTACQVSYFLGLTGNDMRPYMGYFLVVSPSSYSLL